jgi:aspartate carbamoyltransferase regulatory subunit
MKELVNGFDFNNTEYKQVEEPTTREMEHNLNLNITTEPLKLEKDIITIESKPLEVDINVVNPETGETELIDDKKLTEKAKLELIEKMKKRLDLNE